MPSPATCLRITGNSAPALSPSSPQEDAFQEGLVALQENRLETALEKLTTAEQQHSSDARIRNFRGIVLARLEHSNEAKREYQEAIRLDPSLEDAHRNLGFLEWTEHHLEQATAELRRALELAPDDSYAHYYLGRVQLDANLYADGFRELDRSGIAWPRDPTFLMQAARGYIALGRLQDASKTADHLKSLPLTNEQVVNAAEMLLSLKQNESGIDLLRKSHASSVSPGWATFDLALAYLLSGQYGRAEQMAREYVRALPASDPLSRSAAWSLIGIAKRHLGENEAAVDALHQATALAPSQEEYWLNLTLALMELNRYAEAISATRAGLAANPRSYALHLRLGAAYLSIDRYAEAEQTFRELVQAGDPLPTSYIGLAQVLMRTGRAEEAVDELARARQKLGTNFLISYFEGLALSRSGKPEQARAAFEEAVQLNPRSSEAHLGLGKSELAMHKLPEAIRELEETLRLDPENVQAQRLLRQARGRQEAQGSPPPSEAALAEATPAHPEHLLDDFILPAWKMPSQFPNDK